MSDIEQAENIENKTTVASEELIAVAKNLMTDLLKLMDADINVTVSEREGLPLLSLKGDDEGMLIGHHGDTLQALQILLSLMPQKHFHGEAAEVLVDVDDYMERRRDTLTQMAIKLANKAIDSQRSVSVKPLPPQERRIIHLALKEYPGVSTHSTGEGDERYIVIVPNEQ